MADNKLQFIVTVDDKQIDEFKSKLAGTGAEVKKISSATQQVSTSANAGFASMTSSAFGYTIAIGAVVTAMTRLATASLQAFMQQETALTRLKFAVDNSTGSLDRLIQDASRLQESSIFPDEVIMQAQSFLAIQGRTEEQIRKTVQAAIDLSAVTGEDLISVVMKLDQTFEGTIGRFGKLDSSLKDLTEEQLRNGAAVDIIANKYKGLGETLANTTQGQIQQTKNIWGELTEGLGAGIADVINPLTQAIKYLGIGVKDLGQGFIWLFSTLIPPVFALKNIFSEIEKIKNKIPEAKSEILALRNAFYEFYNSIPVIGSALTELIGVFDWLTSSILTAETALLDLPQTQDNISRKQSTAREPEAEAGTKEKKKAETKKQARQTQKETVDLIQKEIEAIDNIIKLAQLEQRLKFEILVTQLEKINSLKNENNTIEQKIKLLEKEREITDKIGKLVNLKKLEPKTLEPGVVRPPVLLPNRRATGIPFLDATAEMKEKADEMERKRFQTILDTTGTMVDNFGRMLSLTGLMNSEFGRIISLIKSVLDTGSSLFDIVNSIAGLANPVTAIGGVSGGGTLANNLGGLVNQYGTPRQQAMQTNVYIKTNLPMLEFMKAGIKEYEQDRNWRRIS